MTPDPAAFAALLCDYCLEVTPGQQVVVRSTSLAAPLLLALQRAVLEREAWPHLRVALPEQEAGFWAAARDVHLDSFPPLDLAEASGVDAAITIQAPENTRALAGVDPAHAVPRRSGAGAGAGGGLGAAVVRVGVADAGAGPAGRHVVWGLCRVRAAGAVPRPRRSGRRLA